MYKYIYNQSQSQFETEKELNVLLWCDGANHKTVFHYYM